MIKIRHVLVLFAIMAIMGAMTLSTSYSVTAQTVVPTSTRRQAITAETAALVKPVGIQRPSYINGARWSLDGRQFAVTDDVGLWLMNPADLTAAPLRLFAGASSPRNFAFSPAGTLIAIGYQDVTILWDVASGTQRSRLQAHSGAVGDVVFSPDGTLLASANNDGTIRLWRVADGKSLAILADTSIQQMTHIAFNADGTLLAAAGDEDLRLWDVKTYAPKWIIASAPSGSHSINNFSNVGFNKQQLYAISDREGLRYWNLDGTGPVLAQVSVSTLQKLFSYVPSSDGSSAATIEAIEGSHDTLSIWSSAIPSGARHVLSTTVVYPWSLTYRSDGRLLAVVYEGKLTLWDTKTFQVTAQAPEQPAKNLGVVTFSPDGASFVVTSVDGVLELWSVASLTVTARFDHGCKSLISFSPDSTLLAAFCGTVHVWDIRTVKQVNMMLQDDVLALTFSADNASLITLDSTLKVRIWDMKSKRFKTSPKTYVGAPSGQYGLSIGQIAVSDDGQLIALSSGQDAVPINKVAIFNLFTGTLLSTIQLARTDCGGWCHVFAFSPNKSLLAIGLGGHVALRDTKTGQMRQTLTLMTTDDISALAFSPDGSLLAVSGPGRAITLWDVQREAQVAVLNASQSNFRNPYQEVNVFRLAFSADGTLLISDMAEGTRFWTVQPDFF